MDTTIKFNSNFNSCHRIITNRDSRNQCNETSSLSSSNELNSCPDRVEIIDDNADMDFIEIDHSDGRECQTYLQQIYGPNSNAEFNYFNYHSPVITNSDPRNQFTKASSLSSPDELNSCSDPVEIMDDNADMDFTEIDHSDGCDECKTYLQKIYEPNPDAKFNWPRYVSKVEMQNPLKNGDTDFMETLYNFSHLYSTGHPDETFTVSIEGEMSPAFVGAIPSDVSFIILGPGVNPAAVSAIPPHIFLVKLHKEVTPQAIAAIPIHIKRVLFGNGITPEAAASLPSHIETVGITDIVETEAQSQRSVHLKKSKVQSTGVTKETVDAIPPHITVGQAGYGILIRQGKPLVQSDSYASNLVANSSSIGMITTPDSNPIFHIKLSSAFKVSHEGEAGHLLEGQTRKGWRWVSCGIISNKNYSQVAQSIQIPMLSEGDWIVSEGKTLRIVKENSTNQDDKRLYQQLEQQFAQVDQYNVELKIKNMLTRLHIGAPAPWRFASEINILYPGDLPPQIFESSYARLAGAYLRHLERRPKLQEAFHLFFDFKVEPMKFSAELYGSTPRKYQKCLSIQLKKNKIIEDKDIPFIRSLGVDLRSVNAQSTVENTIPLKKVLEILTCFDTDKYKDCPWLVSLTIFGGARRFLLSQWEGGTQLLVSIEKESNRFIGNSYNFWMYAIGQLSKTIDRIVNNPISESSHPNSQWKNILEFVVCTQVVESHCTPKYLENSRVPGAGKLFRSIVRSDSKNNSSLSDSFDYKRNGKRKFPLIGNGGTRRTRDAVKKLRKPDDCASCIDMSDDSEVEELPFGEIIHHKTDTL